MDPTNPDRWDVPIVAAFAAAFVIGVLARAGIRALLARHRRHAITVRVPARRP